MAFSGGILSLQDVEKSILDHVLLARPPEVWLSARAHVARFGDIFGNSRAVLLAEHVLILVCLRQNYIILYLCVVRFI